MLKADIHNGPHRKKEAEIVPQVHTSNENRRKLIAIKEVGRTSLKALATFAEGASVADNLSLW